MFGPWADWLRTAAEVKGAPVDFVALALLSTASAIIGKTSPDSLTKTRQNTRRGNCE